MNLKSVEPASQKDITGMMSYQLHVDIYLIYINIYINILMNIVKYT